MSRWKWEDARVKTAYHHGNLRQTLLDATLELIDEQGVDGFTLREVARRADVSHAAPYHHFSDRATLVAALVEQSFDQLNTAMREAADTTSDPRERLTRLGTTYVLWAWRNPARFRVMWRPELRRCEDEAQVEAAADDSYRILQDTLKRALPPARRTEAEIDGACLTAWSAVHGFAVLLLDGPLSEDIRSDERVEAMAAEVVARTVRGVLAAPRR